VKRRLSRLGVWPMALLIAVLGVGIAGVAVAATTTGPDPTEIMPAPGPEGAAVDRQIPGDKSPAHLPTTAAPRPPALPVVGTGSELGANFAGLTFHNQRRDADSGNQLSLEPPDQGLCVGNGIVIEAVNDVFTTYNATTKARTGGFESLNQFFVGDHQIVRHADGSATFGTFLSDPRCVYDAATNRFFMSILGFGRDPVTGAFQAPAETFIATSKSGTPSTSPSDWNFFSIDSTNDGRNGEQSHPGCPCFGDQPLIGVDAYGVYISTNEFPIVGAGFNGAQLYAVQKSALVAGTTPHVWRHEGQPIASTGYGGGIPYSLQPISTSGSSLATTQNGTEYLVGALEFGKKPFQLDNRIAVWALTNTASLNDATPNIGVSDTVIASQVYGLPPAIVQPKGPTPLGDSLKEHENLLDGGDDRMQAAVYANGKLWAAGDTIVKPPNGSTQVGVVYYVISPSVSSAGVSASVVNGGYISVDRNSVTRPALGVNASGKAVIGVSLAGPDYFPSAAYATLTETSAPTALHLIPGATATVPADGFTGYRAEGGDGAERWGDYAFAAVDGSSIWVGNEWIPGPNQGADLAAWGTYLSKVTP
jgi:hypothetical protein